MAELYDEGIFSCPDSKGVEANPEMLDYTFVKECNCIIELRAILKSLVSGQYGRYPDLEETVQAKLISLLPVNEREKIIAFRSKPSSEDVKLEKNRLHDWLIDMTASIDKIDKIHHHSILSHNEDESIPIRGKSSIKLEVTVPSVDERNESTAKERAFIRKERMSTKEYFESWAKFDAGITDDSEDEVDLKAAPAKQVTEDNNLKVQRRREKEISQLRKRLAQNEFTLAEKKFMSIREREKGNEYFNVGENEDAAACYSKSILFDKSNAKSYANRAMVSIRLEKFENAINDCTKAYKIDPSYVKALARRGMIYHKTERYEKAVEDFKKCTLLEPCAGYSKLLLKSEEKLRKKLSKSSNETTKIRMVIHECDCSMESPSMESEEHEGIEEIYTPGLLESMKSDVKLRGSFLPAGNETKEKNKSLQNTCNSNGSENKLRMIALGETDVRERENSRQTQDASYHATNLNETSTVNTTGRETEKVGQSSNNVLRQIRQEKEEKSENLEGKGFHTQKVSNVINGSKTSLSFQNIEETSDHYKEKGNEAMMSRSFLDAIAFYSHALDMNSTNVAALNNRSLAYFKIRCYEKSIEDASLCLTLEPKNVKALYRRGLAKMMSSKDAFHIEMAQADFSAALALNPSDEQSKILMRELSKCSLKRKELAKQRFNLTAEDSKDNESNNPTSSDEVTTEPKKKRSYDTEALRF